MTNAQERKAQERQARRRRIQEAARTVFAERGYAGASIELIARAAQLSVGAIYLYFRSKEDLYVSLVEDALTVFDVEMGQVRDQLETSKRLRATWKARASCGCSRSPRFARSCPTRSSRRSRPASRGSRTTSERASPTAFT